MLLVKVGVQNSSCPSWVVMCVCVNDFLGYFLHKYYT